MTTAKHMIPTLLLVLTLALISEAQPGQGRYRGGRAMQPGPNQRGQGMGMGMTSDEAGFQISFGGQNDYVSSQEFDARLRELAIQNQRDMDASMGNFTNAQITANELMLRTMLVASRSERREDLGTMMTVWNEDRKQLEASTEDSLRFLLRNQIEGRREIGNLTNVLSTITNQQDNKL